MRPDTNCATFSLEKTTELRRRSCPEFDNTTAEFFMSSCSAERFKIFGSVRVCQGNRTTQHVRYALGPSSIAQPFDSLCSKVFDEHPTAATPKEQKLCAATSQNHSVSTLDTPARWVTSAHGQALTIIAEGQHPATPCGHLCFGTHVSRCSQLMFAQFPVAFGLLTRTNNPGLHPSP